MRFKFTTSAIVAALSISLLGATSASAATEFGNNCVGNTTAAGVTPISLANGPGNPLPATILSSGVITSWRLSIVPIPPGVNFTETLKIFRPTGGGQFQVAGESAPIFVASGTNAYPTRIPVKAGDHIGGSVAAGGETGGIFCETENPGDRLGFIGGNPGTGSFGTIILEEASAQLPIVVSVEPDADNDGFGDETQDACSQSAAFQTPCPPVALSTSKQVRKGSVTIIVTSSTAAPVTVNGVVKLGKGKKAKLSGGTKNLTPGVLGKFTLRFSKALKTKLKELAPKQKLTLNVTVSGTSVSGAVTTKVLKLKLKGQGPKT